MHARSRTARRTARTVAAVSLAMAAFAAGAATPTTPFVAHYDASKSGLPLGSARFSLQPASGHDCFVYRGAAHPNALAGLFLGTMTDQSRFCVVDGHVRPHSFSHHIEGKPHKSYTLTFDWAKSVVHYADGTGREASYPLKGDVQDPLSLQIAARRWLTAQGPIKPPVRHVFRLADDDGVHRYPVTLTGGETLATPAGRYDTRKLSRSDKPHDALVFWLAPGEAWLPIQVRDFDNGSAKYTLRLHSLTMQPNGGTGKE